MSQASLKHEILTFNDELPDVLRSSWTVENRLLKIYKAFCFLPPIFWRARVRRYEHVVFHSKHPYVARTNSYSSSSGKVVRCYSIVEAPIVEMRDWRCKKSVGWRARNLGIVQHSSIYQLADLSRSSVIALREYTYSRIHAYFFPSLTVPCLIHHSSL